MMVPTLFIDSIHGSRHVQVPTSDGCLSVKVLKSTMTDASTKETSYICLVSDANAGLKDFEYSTFERNRYVHYRCIFGNKGSRLSYYVKCMLKL